jgi:hypothetical protein
LMSFVINPHCYFIYYHVQLEIGHHNSRTGFIWKI